MEVVSAVGKLVMPGGIDPHTHLAMPFMGQMTCDDFTRSVRPAALVIFVLFFVCFGEEGGRRREREGVTGDAIVCALKE